MRWYTLNQQYDKRYYEVKDALSKTLNVSLNVFYIQKYCVWFVNWREGISDPSSARLAVTKTKDISCDGVSHVTVRYNCWAAWRNAVTMSRLSLA